MAHIVNSIPLTLTAKWPTLELLTEKKILSGKKILCHVWLQLSYSLIEITKIRSLMAYHHNSAFNHFVIITHLHCGAWNVLQVQWNL